jgi:hypothetical protein
MSARASYATTYKVALTVAIVMLVFFGGTFAGLVLAPEWIPRRNPRGSLASDIEGAFFVANFWAWMCWFLVRRVARRVIIEDEGIRVFFAGKDVLLHRNEIVEVSRWPTSLRIPLNHVFFDLADGQGRRSVWVIEGALNKLLKKKL